MKLETVLFGVLLPALSGCASAQAGRSVAEFEQRLSQLQSENAIPGMTAGIAKGKRIGWVKAFGLADVERNIPATDSTVYHLASLTKPFAAVVLLQLIQEGKLSLDDPISKYGIALSADQPVLVKHLLSHTSQGTPGMQYRYSGDRFGRLDSVITRLDGRSFARAVNARVVAPLRLRWTATMPTSSQFAAFGRDSAAYAANLARGYAITNGRATPIEYPTYVGGAAGMTSNVADMLAFSMALDDATLLRPDMRALAFTPTVTPAGDTLPYGLGWFSTRYKGVRVVWHYGLWTGISSLIIKVPERALTFVLLANADRLSSPYQLGAGRLESSPWATAFLDAFVIGSAPIP